jgi:hypothetical protein
MILLAGDCDMSSEDVVMANGSSSSSSSSIVLFLDTNLFDEFLLSSTTPSMGVLEERED